MAGTNTVALFVIFFGISRIIANNDFKNNCNYNLIKSFSKHSLNFSVDAEFLYGIYDSKNGCMINVNEIYKNITKHVTVDRSKIFVSLGFFCQPSNGSSDIHFTFSDASVKFGEPEISVEIILTVCSIYMDDLAYFQQDGYIWSVVTKNASYIYPGVSCSNLKDLRMLSSSLPCAEDNNSKTKGLRKAFFWEMCDPFEKLHNLRLEGCAANPYEMKHAFIQVKFPKLQTLWMRYMNLSLTQLLFPWTNVYIDSSDTNSVEYLSYYKESETYDNNSIARSINIYDSTVHFDSDVTFDGYIYKIVINNVKIPKLDTIFMKISGLVVLDLSYNEIEVVDRNVFLMQIKLMRLNLANNRLTTLPEDVFDSVHSLMYLDLSSNKIVAVNQRQLKYLLKLNEINLKNNSIKTLPNDFLGSQINSIQYVSLSKNPLQVLPLNAFYAPKVLLVDIQHCEINSTSLLSLLNNINLYEMETAYTQSKKLQPFHLRTFDLSNNNITDIPVNLFQADAVTKFESIIQSFSINLDGNPLDCTCKIILSYILANLYVKQGLYIDWKCQYPIDLRGRLMITIEPNETYCSADLKYCPIRCQCYSRFGNKNLIPESNRTFIIDCRHINITSMPLVMPIGRLELWFRNSSLIEITPRDYLKNVIVLDVSYNRINQITNDTVIALSNVKTLKLDHNNLTHLPKELTRKNMSSITLSRNPFICDCKTKWMKSWLLQRTNPVTDWKDIECTYNSSRVGQMISLQDSVFVCNEQLGDFRLHEHVIFPSIIIGSVLFVLVSISLLVIFNRFTINVLLFLYCGFRPFDKKGQRHKNALYDAFVLYSYADRVFIQHSLEERLKMKGFKVADLYKDLIVGFSFLQNIEIFIRTSKRIIFCWTDEMLKDDLIISAWNTAYERAVKHDLDLLILVVDSDLNIGACSHDNLSSFLKRGRYIKKHSKYMFASVDYLMPRINSKMEINVTTDENGEEEIDIPMLATVSNTCNDYDSDLIYVSYPEDLDVEIRQELIPYLLGKGKNIKVLEHDFTPGVDIREEIHTKLDNSQHFIFIVSKSVFDDDVKMFILTTVISKSKLRNTNYLLLFTSEHLHDVFCTNEFNNYMNNFVTGSTRDVNFKTRLLQALDKEFNKS